MPNTDAPQARLSAQPPSADSGREVADEDFLFHLYRGSELLQDDRVHEAKEELELALTYQPRDSKGQDLLGVVYFRLGHYPRAIQIYETLRNQNPREPSVRLNLALCYLKTAQAGRAREELEALVKLQPANKRAWGYLGLAYERSGEFARAHEAFERGGHGHMAKRIAQRGTGSRPSEAPRERHEESDVRQAVSVAFQELDAGELSFSLASPSVGPGDAGTSWRAVELGTPASNASSPSAAGLAAPSAVPTREQGSAAAATAPAPTAAPLRPPALRMQPTIPAPDTLPGVGNAPVQGAPVASPGARALGALGDVLAAARLPFPESAGVAVIGAETALVTTSEERPFAARLEALRSYAGAIACKVMDRKTRDKPSSEPLGGIGVPIVSVGGAGQLVLAPRPSHALIGFRLDGGPVYVREDRLLGFELSLAYETGRLSTGDSDGMLVVQLRGSGAILLELIGSARAIGHLGAVVVTQARAATVRREALVGWTGHLVPRAVPPAEAPAAQRGLVSFAGEGTVLVASM